MTLGRMAERKPLEDLVCFCMRVERERIVEAIRNGATTVEDIQRATNACTGCGTCRWDIEGLITEVREQP